MNEHDRKQMFKKTFDSVADGYDNPAMRFFAESVPPLVSFLELNGDEKVLDVATGTGHTALGLAKHLSRGAVWGIDFSKGMLAKAQEKQKAMGVDNVTFLEMDMQCIDLPKDHFDLAMCSFGIFFVENMAGQLAHMAQTVKPGGRVATSSWYQNLFSPQADLFLDRLERHGVEIPPMTWKRVSTPSKCSAIFKEAGLADVTTFKKKIGYYLPQIEQWWDICWNAGYRGLINQLPEGDLDSFKKAHLAEVEALFDENGLWLNIEVIYTIGTKTRHPEASLGRNV